MADAPALRLSPLHRAWRLLPARQRRRLLARAAAALAPRIDRAPPPASGGIALAGELSRPSGLGESARLLARGLEKLEIACTPIDLSRLLPAADAAPSPVPWPRLPPGMPLLLHVNAPLLPLTLLRLPRGFARGRRVVGYWAWELPTLPPDWRDGARFVHEVWVPSRFTAEAVAPLLPGRVRVVPPPIALAPPAPAPLGRDAFGLPPEAVVVLCAFNLASSCERKNPLAAIAAFRAAFGDRKDRVLVMKVGHPDHAPADFTRIRAATEGAANIRLETRTMSRADSHALMAAADIVVSLHRSEGLGLVPAEAMLLGKPVIATGWSGNLDFMDATSAALVGYRLVPARDPRGVYDLPATHWAEPDLQEAADWLRRLADDPAARADLGGRGKAAAEARLGIGPLAAALAGLGLIPAP